jgi:hypothetical protein
MVSKKPKKVAKDKKMLLRKVERAYARSISLRDDQIKRLDDMGIANVSELFQKLLDEWLITRDRAEAVKLRERKEFLSCKIYFLMNEKHIISTEPELQALREEVNELDRKAEEIEENVAAAENEKHNRESRR